MSGIWPQVDPEESCEALVGRTIAGKFAIERVIGVGAMGAVYRARQITLDKVVAIKVMRRGLAADPTFAARFHREAKAASRLDHPNSIRVLDFGEEPDGLLYISMDYLDGRDLLKVINEDWPLPTERIVEILSQALSALAVAHEMGVLHRDLKPENIMVLKTTADDGSPRDLVKVCDFGIAKIIETRETESAETRPQRSRLSTGGVVVGTPAYMSPEQAKSEPIDARTDLYSMGIVLYQMLTMCVPFEAPTAVSTLLKHVTEEPPPPSTVSSAVDPLLEAVCLRAIRKKPADRFQSARDMRAALRAVVVDGRHKDASPAISGATLARMHEPSGATYSTPTLPELSVPRGTLSQKPSRTRPLAMWLAPVTLAVAASALLLARARHPRSAEPPTAAAATGPSAPAPPPGEGNPPETASIATPPPPALGARAPAPTSASPPATRKPHRPQAVAGSPSPAPAAAPEPEPEVSPNPPPAVVILKPSPPAPPPEVATQIPVVAAPARAFNPDTAHVEVGAPTGTTGTTASSVAKAIAPASGKMTSCYRAALSEINGPADASGTLHLETNEDGVIVDARLNGRLAATSAGRCIAAAVRGRKIANVDTGSASADVPLAFRSR